MRRKVWAWPIGIVGNALLFTVFFAVGFTGHGGQVLFGQAGRQVFFIITSIYGWWAWRQTKRTRSDDAPAVDPRWATAVERAAYVTVWLVGLVVCWWLFKLIGRRVPGPLVLLLVRCLDLHRLDDGDLRDGPRLERLLADVARRRPGRGCRS